MDIKLVSSVLFVKDIQASRHFYETVLGQKVLIDHGPNVGFEGGFAIWQTDHAHQMIFGTLQGKGKDNSELYFETNTLDDFLNTLEDQAVKFIHPIREQPWGQRVVRFYDLDDNIIEVGEPMPAVIVRYTQQGLTAEQIAAKTSMPLEIVKQILEAK
jgi:catechol 2,3-dioxygenase-like lactoylglutathione lyase family enzyme